MSQPEIKESSDSGFRESCPVKQTEKMLATFNKVNQQPFYGRVYCGKEKPHHISRVKTLQKWKGVLNVKQHISLILKLTVGKKTKGAQGKKTKTKTKQLGLD